MGERLRWGGGSSLLWGQNWKKEVIFRVPRFDGVCFWRQLGRSVLRGGCCVVLRRLLLFWP